MNNKEVRRIGNWSSDELIWLHIAYCGLFDKLHPLKEEALALKDQDYSGLLMLKVFELTGRANWADRGPLTSIPNQPQVEEDIPVIAEMPDRTKL